jgi:hypothetical protein
MPLGPALRHYICVPLLLKLLVFVAGRNCTRRNWGNGLALALAKAVIWIGGRGLRAQLLEVGVHILAVLLLAANASHCHNGLRLIEDSRVQVYLV